MSNETSTDGQIELATKALELKRAGETGPDHPPTEDHPGPGTTPIPRLDYPPSGAFDAEGQRPVLERARKER